VTRRVTAGRGRTRSRSRSRIFFFPRGRDFDSDEDDSPGRRLRLQVGRRRRGGGPRRASRDASRGRAPRAENDSTAGEGRGSVGEAMGTTNVSARARPRETHVREGGHALGERVRRSSVAQERGVGQVRERVWWSARGRGAVEVSGGSRERRGEFVGGGETLGGRGGCASRTSAFVAPRRVRGPELGALREPAAKQATHLRLVPPQRRRGGLHAMRGGRAPRECAPSAGSAERDVVVKRAIGRSSMWKNVSWSSLAIAPRASRARSGPR